MWHNQPSGAPRTTGAPEIWNVPVTHLPWGTTVGATAVASCGAAPCGTDAAAGPASRATRGPAVADTVSTRRSTAERARRIVFSPDQGVAGGARSRYAPAVAVLARCRR